MLPVFALSSLESVMAWNLLSGGVSGGVESLQDLQELNVQKRYLFVKICHMFS